VNEDEVLERLRAAARQADPPPAHVLAVARGAHARAGLDGELLELQFDTLMDDAATPTRAGPGRRVLRFGTPDCGAELELAGTRPVDVVGQVSPAAAGVVELTHAGGVARAEIDDLGRFAVDVVPPGPVTLAWTVPDGRRVRTSWVAI
jgi:hypothetical protein